MGVLYNSRIVTDGLVFCVDAGDKMSYPGAGTTWTDLTANKYNGALTNGPTFNSANGGSLIFDGTDDLCRTTLPNDVGELITYWDNINWVMKTYKYGNIERAYYRSGFLKYELSDGNVHIKNGKYFQKFIDENNI